MSTEQQTTTTEPAALPPTLVTTTPDATSDDGAELNLDQRAETLIAQLETEAKAAARETADTPADTAPAKTEAKPAPEAAPPGEPKTPEQIATERRARLAAIDKMAEEERQRHAARRTERNAQPPPQAAPPPAVAPPFDPKDPASVFRFIETHQVPPQAVADWLATANDPQRAAEAVAKRTLSPVEQRIADLEAYTKNIETKLQQRDQAAQEQVAVAQAQTILASHVQTVAKESPLSARLHARKPKDFFTLAGRAADMLPEGFGAQDVIDKIEEHLSELYESVREEPAQAAPSTKQATKPAAAKANVGNRLAAERATAVEPDDEESGDLDERARRLKARLAAAG